MAAPAFAQTNIPGLAVWLKAGDGPAVDANGLVHAWTNATGSGADAVQPDESARPVLATNAVNGLPAVRFDGQGRHLTMAGLRLWAPGDESTEWKEGLTILAVVRPDAAAADDPRFVVHAGSPEETSEWGDVASAQFGLAVTASRLDGQTPVDWNDSYQYHSAGRSTRLDGAAPTNAFAVVAFHSEYGPDPVYWGWYNQQSLRWNGRRVEREFTEAGVPSETSIAYADQREEAAGPVTIGGQSATRDGADRFFKGDIAEILVFTNWLSPHDLASVEGALAEKYGIADVKTPAPRLDPPYAFQDWDPAAPVDVSILCPLTNAVIRYTVDGSAPNETSPEYSAPIRVETNTLIQARAFAPGLPPSDMVARRFLPEQDAALPRLGTSPLDFWMRAGDGVTVDGQGRVSDWLTIAGWWGASARGGMDSSLPTLVLDGASGHPVVRFDGANGLLHFADRHLVSEWDEVNELQGATIFAVVRAASPSGLGFVVSGGGIDATNDFFGSGTLPDHMNFGLAWNATAAEARTPLIDGSPDWNGAVSSATHGAGTNALSVVTFRVEGRGAQALRVNGALLAGTLLPDLQSLRPFPENEGASGNLRYAPVREEHRGPLTLGAQAWREGGAARFFQGDIAEIIMYNVPLGEDEMIQVETMLSNRYLTGATQLPAPVLTPPGGIFSNAQNVAISGVPEGAEARYTLDGAEPGPGSALATGAVTVSNSAMLRVRLFKDGFDPSPVVSVEFIIDPDPPALSEPTASWWDWGLGWYSEPLTNGYLLARDVHAGISAADPRGIAATRIWVAGSLAHEWVREPGGQVETNLSFSADLDPAGLTSSPVEVRFAASDSLGNTSEITRSLLLRAQAPSIQPAGGLFGAPQFVSVVSALEGATVRYTLDGGEPGETSPIAAGPVAVAASATLKARVFKNGYAPSTTASAEFTIDTEGPIIENVTFGGAPLLDGLTVSNRASIAFSAADPSGVATAEIAVDGIVIGNLAAAPFSALLDPDLIEDGPRTLRIRATDRAGNATEIIRAITIAATPPPAPAITAPGSGFVTPDASIHVRGNSQRATDIVIKGNGATRAVVAPNPASGQFQIVIALEEGTNILTAAARNRAGEGDPSPPVAVIRDSSVPAPPAGFTAKAIAGGKIQLNWFGRGAGALREFRLYRAQAPFDETAQAVRIVSPAGTATAYTDAPPSGGTWHYRIAAVNPAGTESALSEPASATVDTSAPVAAIQYAPRGPYDPATGRTGPGLVDVSVSLTEPADGVPFLSITPRGGAPIPVPLTVSNGAFDANTVFTGFLNISASTPSGPAAANYSARDAAGNRGATISQGATLLLDTAGPIVTNLAVVPGPVIRNDATNPVEVAFTAVLDEIPATDNVPLFAYTLSASGVTPVTVTNLLPGAASNIWSGTFLLPPGAGAQPESLALAFEASDDLGNVSTRIVPPHAFEVYQGALPPFDAPLALAAKPAHGGRVDLTWQSVPGAVDYEIQRKAPGESAFSFLARAGAATAYSDPTPSDGLYTYAVATVRREGAEESTGALSQPATAVSDRVPPPAPANLALELTPQGVQAAWTEPDGLTENVTYALYRAAAAPISDLTGLAPVTTQSSPVPPNGRAALDAQPTTAARYYAVAAVDAAGNVSAPSNTGYQNVDLLPVGSLVVGQIGNFPPLLVWHAASGAVQGYRVYLGAGTNGQVVSDPDPQPATNHIDFAWTPGQSRTYSVTVVDDTAAEGMARSVTLPPVAVALAPDAALARGLMNRLAFTVSSQATNDLPGAGIRLKIAGREYKSPAFTIPAGATNFAASLVVPGAADLALGTVTGEVTLAIEPNPGESAQIIRATPIPVQDGAPAITLLPSEFHRGGNGRVRFQMLNTSPEPIEIVSALERGAKPSPHVRVRLLDAAGNILATAPLAWSLGNDIVTLPSGESVLRLDPGAEATSPEMLLPVPEQAGSPLRLELEIDQVYYHRGLPDQVEMDGYETGMDVPVIETSYRAEITGITPESSTGQTPVAITGRAIARATGQPLGGVPVKLVTASGGFERTDTVATGPDGLFQYDYLPEPGEPGGVYTVSATHPDLNERPAQGQFTILRLGAAPLDQAASLPKGYAVDVSVRGIVSPGLTAANARLEYRAEDQPGGAFLPGLTVAPAAGVDISPNTGAQSLAASITAGNAAPPAGTLVFRLVSDGGPAEGWGLARVRFTVADAGPVLRADPVFLETGVNPGSNLTEIVTLRNDGYTPALDAAVELRAADGTAAPAWAQLLDGPALGDIEVGASRRVGIAFQPPAGLPEGAHDLLLRVTSPSHPTLEIGVRAVVSLSGEGQASVQVVNLFTGLPDPAYTDGTDPAHPTPEFSGLAGARVRLESESVATNVFTHLTDGYGVADFGTLPAGAYKLRVTADKHAGHISRLTVKPGAATSEQVVLKYNPVTITWEVVPTEIQDRYDILLTTTFETDVPAPLLIADPPSRTLPDMKAGEVFRGEYILYNKGLIRATEVRTTVPQDDPWLKYELLSNVPETIEAQQFVRVAYRLTAKKDFSDGSATPLAGAVAPPPPWRVGGPQIAANFNRSVFGSLREILFFGAVNLPPRMRVPAGHGFEAFESGGPAERRRLDALAHHPAWSAAQGGGGGGGGGGPCGGSVNTVYKGPCSTGGAANHGLNGPTCGGGEPMGGWGDGPGGEWHFGPPDKLGHLECPPPNRPPCDIPPPECKNCEREKCDGEKEECTGSLVDLANGEYKDAIVDLAVPSPSGVIEVWREFRATAWRLLDLDDHLTFSGDPAAPDKITVTQVEFPAIDSARTLFQHPAGGKAWQIVRLREGTNTAGFRASWPGGKWRDYDPNGRLVQYGGRNGATARVLRDTNGLATGWADASGTQRVWVAYSPEGQVASLSDSDPALQNPAARTVHYTWTGSNLVSVTDLAGDASEYHYAGGKLVWKREPGEGETRIAYDNDRVASVTDALGNGRFFDYSFDHGRNVYYAAVRTSGGLLTERWLDRHGELVEKRVNGVLQEKITRDGRNRLIEDGLGRVTRREFDDWGNLVRETGPDGATTTIQYDPAHGRPIRETDPLGKITTHSYDARGNRVSTTEGAGTGFALTSIMEYDAAGRATRRTEPGGRVVAYEYDALGRLLRAREGAGTAVEAVTEYEYDALGRRTGMCDALGNWTRYALDPMGRLIAETNALGAATLYRYDFGRLVETETGVLPGQRGRITRTELDAAGRAVKSLRIDPVAGVTQVVSQTAYDADGHPVAEINAAGQRTLFEYDAFGRRVKTSTPGADGGRVDSVTAYDAWGRMLAQTNAGGEATLFEYDLRDRVRRQVEAAGTTAARATRHSFDLAGNLLETVHEGAPNLVTRYTYDALGRRTSVAGDRELPGTLEYDSAGRLFAQVDGRGNRTEFAYDEMGRTKTVTTAAGTAEAAATSTEYDLAGRVLCQIDGRGVRMYYHYDALGRRTHESVPGFAALAGNWWEDPAKVRQRTEYNPWGQVVAVYQPASGYAGPVQENVYDGFGRLAESRDASGLVVRYEHDALDNVVAVHYPVVASAAPGSAATSVRYRYNAHNGQVMESVQDRAGNVTRFGYDAALRRVSETRPGSGTTTYEYDALGRTVAATDALGNCTETVFDRFDQPVQVIHPDHVPGSSPGDAGYRIETRRYDNWGRLVEQGGAGQYPVVFGYDPAGNRTTMTDGNNHVTRWEYDAQNRVKAKVYADGTRWEYTYDAGGNLLSRKDAKNQVTGYQYNAYGLPTVVDYASDPDVSFTCDALGRRTGMNDASGTTTWAYDALGRVVTNIQARAGVEMRYSFDVEGRRAQMLVDNRAVVYGYDHAGRLEVVDDDAVALGPMQYVWDAETGRMKEILMPSGAKISMAHDSVGRLTSRAYHGRFGQTLASVGYTHDKAGQRVTEAGNRGSLAFDYDEKRQLIRAEGVTGDGGSPQEYNYSFDPIGNWLTGDIGDAGASEPIAKEFTANAVNQYTEIEVPGGTVMPEYDLNGNTTFLPSTLGGGAGGEGWFLQWDQENRLSEVRTARTRSVFVYDGLGKRVERREYATSGVTDPGTLTETVRYAYDGLLTVEERIWNGPATGAAAKVRKLTRGLDLSGTLEGAGGIGGLLAFTSSGSSAFYFSDGNGNVTHLFDGGDQIKAEYKYDPFGNRLAASGPLAEENAWQCSGKEFHGPSGLVHYLFRHFSPEMGRWVGRDPIEESGGVNLLGYLGNSPLHMLDPFGLRVIVLSQPGHMHVGNAKGIAAPKSDLDQHKQILLQKLGVLAGMPDETLDRWRFHMFDYDRRKISLGEGRKGLEALEVATKREDFIPRAATFETLDGDMQTFSGIMKEQDKPWDMSGYAVHGHPHRQTTYVEYGLGSRAMNHPDFEKDFKRVDEVQAAFRKIAADKRRFPFVACEDLSNGTRVEKNLFFDWPPGETKGIQNRWPEWEGPPFPKMKIMWDDDKCETWFMAAESALEEEVKPRR